MVFCLFLIFIRLCAVESFLHRTLSIKKFRPYKNRLLFTCVMFAFISIVSLFYVCFTLCFLFCCDVLFVLLDIQCMDGLSRPCSDPPKLLLCCIHCHWIVHRPLLSSFSIWGSIWSALFCPIRPTLIPLSCSVNITVWSPYVLIYDHEWYMHVVFSLAM